MFVQVENSKTRGSPQPGAGAQEGIVGIVMNSTVYCCQDLWQNDKPAHRLCSEIFVGDIENLYLGQQTRSEKKIILKY